MLEFSKTGPKAAPRSWHVKTFGCQMNVYDSDRMGQLMAEAGLHEEADLAKADVVLINTCSIRENAENKVLTLLGQLKPIKKQNPDKVLGVTGCVGQRMGRTLLQKAPHLDLVMGPDQVESVATYVDDIVSRGARVLAADLDKNRHTYSQPSLIPKKTKPSEYLTVMKGCDHFCTYCIVPFVRGREKSRPIRELLTDVRKLVAGGTKEVTFLGQNINTYGKGTDEDLVQLIEQANEIEGLERIRYVTSHPRDLTEGMMAQFGSVEKLCPALHLPFQSGSDPVLKRMARLYTQAEYMKKIERLRHHCPDIAMSADVIVGFPGETEEDFKETLKVLDEVGFASVFQFKYSPRPGTRAFGATDEVPEEVKRERLERSQTLANEKIFESHKKMIGDRVEVLVEGLDKKGKLYTGRSPHNRVVHLTDAGPACLNKVVPVTVTEGDRAHLKGTLVRN